MAYTGCLGKKWLTGQILISKAKKPAVPTLRNKEDWVGSQSHRDSRAKATSIAKRPSSTSYTLTKNLLTMFKATKLSTSINRVLLVRTSKQLCMLRRKLGHPQSLLSHQGHRMSLCQRLWEMDWAKQNRARLFKAVFTSLSWLKGKTTLFRSTNLGIKKRSTLKTQSKGRSTDCRTRLPDMSWTCKTSLS